MFYGFSMGFLALLRGTFLFCALLFCTFWGLCCFFFLGGGGGFLSKSKFSFPKGGFRWLTRCLRWCVCFLSSKPCLKDFLVGFVCFWESVVHRSFCALGVLSPFLFQQNPTFALKTCRNVLVFGHCKGTQSLSGWTISRPVFVVDFPAKKDDINPKKVSWPFLGCWKLRDRRGKETLLIFMFHGLPPAGSERFGGLGHGLPAYQEHPLNRWKNKGFHLPKTWFLGTKNKVPLMVLGVPAYTVFCLT